MQIRSIYKNLKTLSDDKLSFFPFLADVIRLSETKIKNSILCNLDQQGYEPILHADSNTKAGCVQVFVAQNLEQYWAKTILSLTVGTEDIWLHIFDKKFQQRFYTKRYISPSKW